MRNARSGGFLLAMGAMALGLLAVLAVLANLGSMPAVPAALPVANTPATWPGPSVPATVDAGPGPSGGLASVDQRVAFWVQRVAANATDYSSTIALIDAYLDRLRATGSLSDLEGAQAALARATDLAPVNDADLVLRRGLVAYQLHDFTAARDAALELLELDPGVESGLALLGDALMELGDVAQARAAYEDEGLEPLAASPAVLARLARVDLIMGDVAAAEAKLRAAVAAERVTGFPDREAAQIYQLAELLRGENRIEEASAAYTDALALLPEHVPSLAGLARVREAQGRRAEAIELLERATAILPSPQFVAELGDLHALAGDAEAAEDAYALVERIAEVAHATGAVYDRVLVVFLADHSRRIDDAVALAEAEIDTRHDVYGHDALAWALYRAGRLDEASEEADAAMRLGTRDGRILYHAGLIAAAQGREADALDLLSRAADHAAALPPLQVPALEAALASLR